MRLLRNRKAQARVIEAFFAATLLLSCLTLIPVQGNSRNTAANSDNLTSRAKNILLSLDSDGQLAKLVDTRDWAALRDSIESSIPLTIWFNLTVYDTNSQVLNQYPICNGGPVSNKITSIDYISASPNSSFAVYILQLQLAAVD